MAGWLFRIEKLDDWGEGESEEGKALAGQETEGMISGAEKDIHLGEGEEMLRAGTDREFRTACPNYF